jgi:hypothetical protein
VEASTPVANVRLTSAEAGGGTSILSPPTITWPVYVLGGIGIGGLATAAIFGGLHANSSHAVDVTKQALLRNGKPVSTCDAHPVPVAYAEVCALYQENKRIGSSQQSAFTTALIVGISGTAAALGWFFLAPKEHGDKTGTTHVVPWIAGGSGGAIVEGRF